MNTNPLKAILRIQLLADDKVIAETEDPMLWRELMVKIALSKRERDTALMKAWKGHVLTHGERNLVEAVLTSVADVRHIPVPVMLGKVRRPSVAHARWLAMYVLRHVLGLSLPVIARVFACHHTTVMNGLEHVQAKLVDYQGEILLVTAAVRAPQ